MTYVTLTQDSMRDYSALAIKNNCPFGLCGKFVRRIRRRSITPETLIASISRSPFEGARKIFVSAPSDANGTPTWSFHPNAVKPSTDDTYHQMYFNTYEYIQQECGDNYSGPLWFRLQKG